MFSNRALDHASEIEQAERESAIDRIRALKSAAESQHFCQDEACGEPIPEARRLAVAGCRFCIDCQARREKAR